MRRDRLQKLAQHLLLNTDPAKFNMQHWFSECGTTACAVGHACSIPDFVAAGFAQNQGSITSPYPCFGHYTAFSAVCAFFDISMRDADYMFCPNQYNSSNADTSPTISNVIVRIEEVAEFEIDRKTAKIIYAFDPQAT